MSGRLIQTPITFVVNVGEKINVDQKVNIDQISKILNFHPIDLKFEEHFHVMSLNSSTLILR